MARIPLKLELTLLSSAKEGRCTSMVVMQVLEQDNNNTRSRLTLYKNADFYLRSSSCPQLDTKEVYIRGADTKKDLMLTTFRFDSIKEAKQYITNVQQLVKEYNESFEKQKNLIPGTCSETFIAE